MFLYCVFLCICLRVCGSLVRERVYVLVFSHASAVAEVVYSNKFHLFLGANMLHSPLAGPWLGSLLHRFCCTHRECTTFVHYAGAVAVQHSHLGKLLSTYRTSAPAQSTVKYHWTVLDQVLYAASVFNST